ncbi:MBL fold metallo-hydrolase [Streptomyces sp. NPDC048179]|uniref:MBL fold metallo-hydrolase n=1 Tax=Streptomyces sp. NPDC048179 TaxID=3365506 RepID=UPI0037127DA0
MPRLYRGTPGPAPTRLHDGLAVHGPAPASWFLANATPDVAEQLENHPDLRPAASHARTPVVRAVLTDAELDHVLGLFRLREASRIEVWATEPVRLALLSRLRLDTVLAPYTPLIWHDLPLIGEARPATVAGLDAEALPLSAKRPRYAAGEPDDPAWSVALRVHDPHTRGTALYAPALAAWSDGFGKAAARTDCLLLDGTFLYEDEPRRTGISEGTASGMGHLPIEGPLGTARQPARSAPARSFYTHLNNTNPLTDPADPAHERPARPRLRVAVESTVISL